MRLLFVVLFLLFAIGGFAQAPHQPSAAEIKLKLQKLNFLGSVLYVAAHPDDENTRVIGYLANGQLAATAYLSMTRGDGGQNLIGPEIRDQLGLIRTQELLAARRIDGGQQFFTRANDFGFSKSADETFTIWNKDEILSDVIRVYRTYQPDVILTRFPPDERAGHGHHTASAMLAIEAFDKAGIATTFTDQVKEFGTWTPTRLFINTGRWWNNTINEETPGIVTLQVGGYNPLLGESYSEMAARSRSQHKSQGFGSRGVRGNQPEFLEFVKGTPTSSNTIFEGINTTWTRLKGGEQIQPLVERAIQQFNFENPAQSIPALLEIRKKISALEPSVWRDRKLLEVNELIEACAGLYLEITADHYWFAPNEKLTASFELLNRSTAAITIESISIPDLQFDTTFQAILKNNIPITFRSVKSIPATANYTDPYWLQQPHSLGLFTVKDKTLIGKPENAPAIPVTFTLRIHNEVINITKSIVYRWTDPVKGELYRPMEIVPPVTVNLSGNVWIFNSEAPKTVQVVVKSMRNKVVGNVSLVLPTGWRTEPAEQFVELTQRGEEKAVSFMVYPSKEESTGVLRAEVSVDGKRYDQALTTIQYDHIPTQTLLPKAEASLSRIDLKTAGRVIGYIRGAGDDIPGALRNMGYDVIEFKNEEVTPENLSRVDAVVLGIRALNANERIRFMMPDLLNYVKTGGTLVVQYNTSFDLETSSYAPYPLSISRDRVTQEDSPVTLLKKDHPLLNYPNKITPEDFKGWVQERGLYFPGKWDEKYDALLAMHDTGETPKEGSLLVAQYGEGYYIYTGLSFFRELPEGVPGAYKLFANLVSAGKMKQQTNGRTKSKSK